MLQCSVKVCKDQSQALFSWALSPTIDQLERRLLDQALCEAVEQLGGDTKSGTCPPSPQERQMKKDINILRKERVLKA